MRIAFVIPSLRSGGAERVFANLLTLWDHRVDEVHLVVLRREGSLFEGLPKAVTVHDLAGRRFLTSLPRLVGLVRSLKPDAILGTQAHINAALGWLKPWLNTPRVVGRESSMPAEADKAKKNSWLKRWVYRQGYRRLDAVVCLSQAMADQVSARYSIPPSQLPLIPNPVLPQPAFEPEVLDPSKTWLVAVGRFEPVKGFDLLLQALDHLPASVGLLLVGDGRLRKDLETQTNSLGLKDRVRFAGFQSQPHRWVAACRAFVLSSRYEGLPNAAIEALTLGVPVAAFDGPWGAREVVVEGVTGFLARPLDPLALAQTIQRVLEHPWDREALQEWARNRYDGAMVTQRYRAVLV